MACKNQYAYTAVVNSLRYHIMFLPWQIPNRQIYCIHADIMVSLHQPCVILQQTLYILHLVRVSQVVMFTIDIFSSSHPAPFLKSPLSIPNFSQFYSPPSPLPPPPFPNSAYSPGKVYKQLSPNSSAPELELDTTELYEVWQRYTTFFCIQLGMFLYTVVAQQYRCT